MIRWLTDSLLGCTHQHTSFPFTPRDRKTTLRGGTYVTCLDCGQEFAYDWKQMRVGEPVKTPVPAPQAQPSYR